MFRKSWYLPDLVNPSVSVAAMVLPDLEGLDNDKRGQRLCTTAARALVACSARRQCLGSMEGHRGKQETRQGRRGRKQGCRTRVERLEVELLVLDKDGAKEEELGRGTGEGGDGGAR